MENVNIKRFKDLKVGDIIYVTDQWDFYKLTIAGIGEGNDENGSYMQFTFVQNSEFVYCDNELNIDSCFQIGKGYLEDFCIECYRDCLFFADKEECRDYLKTLQERAVNALEKLDRCHYSWAYINDNGEEIKNEKVFDTIGECYCEMRKIALLTLEGLIHNVTETHDFNIHCSPDHIKIIGINKRYDWFIVEV